MIITLIILTIIIFLIIIFNKRAVPAFLYHQVNPISNVSPNI